MANYNLIFTLILSFGYLIATVLPGISADHESEFKDPNVKDNRQDYNTVPLSLNTFGEGRPIYGIYRRKTNLFLIRDNTSHVEIYDFNGRNARKGKLEVPGMRGPYDLVGDDDSRSLFIADWFDWANITTVSTKSRNQVAHFPFHENFTVVSLAATNGPSESDVIVTCSQPRKIKEYTKHGKLVRQVDIPVNLTQPRHSIKLKSGRGYAVCHGYGDNENHRVCLLSNTGGLGDCFGSGKGKGKSNLDVCARIAEDDDGNIIVADRNNKRVIVLSNDNGKLKFKQELVRKRDGLDGPTRILIDRKFLYVVDNKINADGLAVSGKVRVFRVKERDVRSRDEDSDSRPLETNSLPSQYRSRSRPRSRSHGSHSQSLSRGSGSLSRGSGSLSRGSESLSRGSGSGSRGFGSHSQSSRFRFSSFSRSGRASSRG